MKTYLRHRILNVVEVKELIALEYLDFEGKYKNYSESHDFWELCFAQSGEISVFMAEKSIILKEGELLLIAPDCEHSYVSSCGNCAKAFVVCFESSSSALKALGGMRFASDCVLKDCMERVIEESKSTFRMNEDEHLEALETPNFGGQQAIMIQLEYLLIRLMRDLSMQKNSKIVFLNGESFYSDLSKVVMSFFEEHIRDDLSLDDVCKRMNYSRSFLCKTFKKQTGQTLMDCFNRMKMCEAKKLLDTTDWQMTQIAAYLGFSEAKYFGALFKKCIGISPSEYRKTNKTEE